MLSTTRVTALLETLNYAVSARDAARSDLDTANLQIVPDLLLKSVGYAFPAESRLAWEKAVTARDYATIRTIAAQIGDRLTRLSSDGHNMAACAGAAKVCRGIVAQCGYALGVRDYLSNLA